MRPSSTVSLHTGNAMPVLGLGTWKLTDNTVEMLCQALELGYRMIDTSSDYGTQPAIGQALKRSGINRNKVYIVSKVEESDDAYKATKQYVQDMGLEYADLMLIHRPPGDGSSEQLWHDLIRARDEGLTRDIGVSNYSTTLIQELIDACDDVPTVNQIEWSPFGHSAEMVAYCDDNDIVIQAYSPLTRAKRLSDQKLRHLAEKYAKSPAQILIRWNLQLATVPLPKASQKKHLEENIDVFDFKLDTDDMAMLSEMNEEYSALGGLQYLQ